MAPPLYNEIIEYEDGTPATQVNIGLINLQKGWKASVDCDTSSEPACEGRVHLLGVGSQPRARHEEEDGHQVPRDVHHPHGHQLLSQAAQVEHDQVQEDHFHPKGLSRELNNVWNINNQVMKCLVWQYLRYHTIPKAFLSVKTQTDSSEPNTPEGPNDMAVHWLMWKHLMCLYWSLCAFIPEIYGAFILNNHIFFWEIIHFILPAEQWHLCLQSDLLALLSYSLYQSINPSIWVGLELESLKV